MKRKKDKPENSLSDVVENLGGKLFEFKFKKLPTTGEHGGCGSPVNVVGTNGGQMPCGSMLTQFGKTAPYYCGHCELKEKKDG
jgi:hypothetical protein